MDIEEFAKYLEPIFEFKRQRAEELASQRKESLARVLARVQERLKSGDLPEDLDVDCGMAGPFLGCMADPLELERPPHWLSEHIALCRDCQGELERLEQLRHIIMVAEMPAPHEEVITDAPLEFMEKVYRLKAIGPEDITCDHAEPYYRNMAICNLEAPAEIYRHVLHCTSCNRQVRQLHHELAIAIPEAHTPEFEELRPEKRKQSLERARARAQERLRIGDLPEDIDVDCQMVRPFLAQAADPLGSVSLPRWFQEHMEVCEDCPQELEQFKELSHAIAVADMPASVQKLIADVPRKIAGKANKLRAIESKKITCDLVSSYYHDMATCDLQVPAEIYRHARFCGSCRDQVNQLRSELNVVIPRSGTPEFIQLRAHLRKGPLRLMPAAVKAGGSAVISWAQERAQSARHKPATLLKYAAVLIIAVVGGWFVVNPTVAKADPFVQMINGIRNAANVCFELFRPGETEPFRKEWLSEDLNIRIREKPGQRLIFEDFNNNIVRIKDLNSGHIRTPDIKTMSKLTPAQKLADFCEDVIPFHSISDIPKGSELKEITDPEILKDIEPGIQVYELVWTEKDRIAGEPILKKWRGYTRAVNNETKRLVKIIRWWKRPKDKEFSLDYVLKINYPTYAQMQIIIKRAGLAEPVSVE